MKNVSIIGTGLIGASVGLALRAAGFTGEIVGVDHNPKEIADALWLGAISRGGTLEEAAQADVIVLAVPVLAILDTMSRLAPLLGPQQLVTDVGSTKGAICELAGRLYRGSGQARFLPGHPMAGKESGGAVLADGALFQDAMWLFTPLPKPTNAVADNAGVLRSAQDDGEGDEPNGRSAEHPLEAEWRGWVARFGCRSQDMDAGEHDKLCAWVSHLPQFVSTAMAALLEDEFGDSEAIRAIGGRALREMTRLGASPYSMWRDVAMTNTDAVGATLFALEQRLAHVRENLKTPELREEFLKGNRFRSRR